MAPRKKKEEKVEEQEQIQDPSLKKAEDLKLSNDEPKEEVVEEVKEVEVKEEAVQTEVEVEEPKSKSTKADVKYEKLNLKTVPVPKIVSDSQHTYASFKELIEGYKAQNPAKYAQKEAILLAQLNALK